MQRIERALGRRAAAGIAMVIALWMTTAMTTTARAATPASAPAAQAPAAATPTVPEQVEAAFRWGDYAELERLYATYGQAGVRSPATGTPRVEHFWMGIGTVLKANLRVTDAYYLESDALTRKWAFEHPTSVMAQLLYAASLKAHAWSQRGEGYVDTVSPMAWAGFHKYLDLAEGQLRRNEALAAHDGSWNYLMLEIGRGQGWDNADLLAVYQAGIAKNPDFDGLDFAMLTALLPRWGGDIATAERFIAQVTKRTLEKRGMEMYARLYASLSYGEVQQALFTGTHVSWPVMKSGFEEWVRRYPHVDNRNEYAYFACMAEDRGALREQLDLIGDQFVAEFWGGNAERTFEACRGFARRE